MEIELCSQVLRQLLISVRLADGSKGLEMYLYDLLKRFKNLTSEERKLLVQILMSLDEGLDVQDISSRFPEPMFKALFSGPAPSDAGKCPTCGR
jgi:hypothetical protein